MSTRTLVEIGAEPRTWDSQYGQMAAFRLTFEDGMKAELVTKAETVEKRRAELKAALGHPGEWVLEDQGAFPDGKPKPQKVKDYPGKPQAKGQGGGSGLSLEDRLKLDEATSDRMDVRTSLMQAVAFHNSSGSTDGTVLETATKYLGWLRAQRSVGAGPKGIGEGPGRSAPTDRTAAGEGEYGVTLDERSHRASAPAAVTNRVEAGEPQPRRSGLPSSDPGKTGDGSSDSRGTEPADPTVAGGSRPSGRTPAASTAPAGDPSPPRVEAPASPGDGSTTELRSPSPGTTPEKCSHPSWKPAPNKDAADRGLMVCVKCGVAQKRKASV